MSPDSFVQIALNTSYYLLYGSFVTAYESVNTKHYNHGRTEAGRTLSREICEYAKKFADASISNAEKLDLLQKSLQRQRTIIKRCQCGKGVDRHLSGLKYMLAYDPKLHRRRSVVSSETGQWLSNTKMETPEIFKSAAYKTLQTTILSTSNCGNPSLRMFGFGPVSEWGFGIGYIIKDYGLQFCISSGHRQTGRFVHTLRNYLRKVVSIMTFQKDLTDVQLMPAPKRKSNENVGRSDIPVAKGKVKWLQDNDFDDEFGNFGYFDMGDLPLDAVDNSSTDDQALKMVRNKSFQTLG